MTADDTRPNGGSILYAAAGDARAAEFERELAPHVDRDVVTARTADAALETFYSTDVAAIVTDHDLPDADAAAFLTAIRLAAPAFPLFLLAPDDESDLTRAMQARPSEVFFGDAYRDQWADLAALVDTAIATRHEQRALTDARATRQTVLDGAADGVVVAQAGTVVYANASATELLVRDGTDPLQGRSLETLSCPGVNASLGDVASRIDHGTQRVATNRVSSPVDDAPSATALATEWRGDRAVLVTCHDHLARTTATPQHRPFERAVEAAGSAVYITDPDGTIEYVNPAFEEMTGYDREDAIGATPRILKSGEASDEYYDRLWETIRSGAVWEEDIVNERQSGEHYVATQTISPITAADGTVLAFVAIQQEITEQQANERRLQHYERAIESSTEMLAAADLEHTFLFANPEYREFHGIAPEADVTTRSLTDVLSRDEFEAVASHLAQVHQGEATTRETTRTNANGERRRIETRYYPLKDDAGDITGVVAAMRDITAQYEREEAIRRLSEDRQIVSAVNQALVRTDSVRELSLQATEILADSDRFECASLVLTSDHAPQIFCESGRELSEHDSSVATQYVKRVQEAGILHLDDATALPFDTRELAGKPALGIALAHDDAAFGVLTVVLATDSLSADETDLLADLADDIAFFLHSHRLDRQRREREREAREQRRRYEALFASIRDAILVTDIDGNIVNANPAFEDLFGYELADIEGEHAGFVLANECRFSDLATAVTEAESQFRLARTLEYEQQSGRVFSGETNVFPLQDADGTVVGFIALVRDISERETRIRQIQVLDRVLRHNLTNRIQVIEGAAEMIRQSSSDGVERHAETIIETGRQLLESIDKERAITQYLREPLETRPIDLVPVVERVVAEIRTAHPQATVTVDLPTSAPAVATPAFDRAVEELLENAIIHSDQDEPTVAVRVVAAEQTIRLAVADDGPGIPQMERDILTEQAEIEPLYHGSGLGLWQVNLIVSQSDGLLELDENDPRGTVVTIHLSRSA